MPEIHLRQLGFTKSACGPSEKSCFQHNMAYRDFIDLTRRGASDTIFRNKALTLLKIQNLMDFLQWLTNFLIKKFQVVLLHFANKSLKMKKCQTKS